MTVSAQGAGHSDLDSAVEAVVRRLHQNDTKAVCYVTGGASQAVAWLLGVPGASNTILEVAVPYCRDSLVSILGTEPSQYCSKSTAIDMARAAYRRAVDMTPFGAPAAGVAATCALASEPPKRGEHRAFLAAHTGLETRVASIRLAKGARSRWQEDALVSRLLVKLCAETAGAAAADLPIGIIAPGSTTSSSGSGGGGGGGEHAPPPAAGPAAAAEGAPAVPAPGLAMASAATQPAAPPQWDDLSEEVLSLAEDPIQELLSGRARCVEFSGGRVFVDSPRSGRVYLPGSFNPLHEGHRQLLAAACRAAGRGEADGCFELSIGNADKGMLPLEEVRLRVAQFTATNTPVVVTCAPLYVNKAALFTNSVFVVGHDTAARLVLPKYYGDSYTGMALEFSLMRHNGCSLLVAGRQDPAPGGRFLQLSDISVPPELSDLMRPIPESEFRSDLSSTALRSKGLGLKAT